MEDKIKLLLASIPVIEQGSRVILGIDGLSRSGKTTLARMLSHMLQEINVQTCVFHLDEFCETS